MNSEVLERHKMIRISSYNLKLFINLIFIIICFLITSCVQKTQNPEDVATTEKYEKVLDSWLGSNDSNLITSWGAPSSTYNMSNGNRILTFIESKSGPAVWMGGMLVPLKFHCKTEFIVDPNNIIVGWRHEGNSCRSK